MSIDGTNTLDVEAPPNAGKSTEGHGPHTAEPFAMERIGLFTARGDNWSGSEEQTLWRRQLRMSTQLILRLDAQLTEKHGLSIADYSALVVIAEGSTEGIRMSTLADVVMISRSRLTHCVDRLEARGLVRRIKAEDDRRGLTCALLPKGRELLDEAVPTHVSGVRALFADHLTPEEMPVLDGFMRKVLGALSLERGQLPKDGHITVAESDSVP